MSLRPCLVRWEAEFKDCGLAVVEVSGGQYAEFDRSRQRLEKWDVRHPVLWDRDNKNTTAYAISGWPSAYLIGLDGRVFWQGNPATFPTRKDDEEAFRRALVAELAKVKPGKRRRPRSQTGSPEEVVVPIRLFLIGLLVACPAGRAAAADWPQWGRDYTRNAVSPETGMPDFAFPMTEDGKVVKPGRNIAWSADLGTQTVIPPVVAGGLVWVGTNTREPADEAAAPKGWDRAQLLCLRESDGKLLWAYSVPRRTDSWAMDFPRSALGSAPLAEGDRLWFVDSRNDVVCLDVGPLQKGTGEPKVLWKLDTVGKLGVHPYRPLMQSGSAASVAGYKDWLYVVTHNGVDEDRTRVPKPDAPSLLCLEKATGNVIWTDNSPGKGILDAQISSPLVAEVGGKVQAIVGQGDGWLRSFDAATGKLIWKCDLNRKGAKYDLARGDRNYVVATPVLYDGWVYIATGQEVEHGDGPGSLYCIDPTKAGDVSRELADGPGKGKPNPNSAVVWHTLGPFPDGVPDHGAKKNILKLRDGYLFGRAVASCTVHEGLVYAADLAGFFFCFDAKTGKPYWIHDLKAYVLGQPLWADGKVYVATEDGDVFVFAHGKQKKLLAAVESNHAFRAGLVFANRTLYATSEGTLYAFRNPK